MPANSETLQCAACGLPLKASAPNGTGEPLCSSCAVAALNHGHYSAAESNRPRHDSPLMQALIDEYARKVPADLGDAHEALAATRDCKLRCYLHDFILRWDATEALERGDFGPDGSDAEKMARALLLVMGQPRNARADVFISIARNALRGVTHV